MKIVIYGKSGCPYCVKAKELSDILDKSVTEPIVMTYIDIAERGITVDRLSSLCKKEVKTVPQVFLDDKHVGGYMEFDTQIKHMIAKGQLVFR